MTRMFRPSGAELFLLPANPMAYAMGYISVAAPRLMLSDNEQWFCLECYGDANRFIRAKI
jgi:hypothetical protein